MGKSTRLELDGGNRKEAEVSISFWYTNKIDSNIGYDFKTLKIENVIHLQNNFKGKCAALGGGGGGLALGMPNVVGVFIVTLGGCLVAT